MLINTGHLCSNDKSRIFINTSLGCTGGCTYCYLPKIGYSNTEISKSIKLAEDIISEIKKIHKVDKNTLISLGCFSECWDANNINETKKLVNHFLENGNQVQLSTKKEIKLKDIKDLKEHIKYFGQLIIFVSFATISRWKEFEKNTDNPKSRFKNFEIIRKYNIPVVLYIKPVLENVTIKDIELFKKAIKKYNIKDTVVGSIFKENSKGEIVPFLKDKNFFYEPSKDEIEIRDNLKSLCNMFTRSTQVTKKYKQV
jgi:DNA repair photolyase